jgi:hypothetical protein
MITKHAIGMAVICAAMLVLSPFGDAGTPTSRTSPAIAGHAWKAEEAGCFNSGWSAVRNNCPGIRKFLIPVHIVYQDGPLPSTVTVNAAAENDTTKTIGPTCRAIMNNFGNGFVFQTQPLIVSRGPSYTRLGVLPVGGPDKFLAGTEAHVECDLLVNSSSGLGVAAVQWVME